MASIRGIALAFDRAENRLIAHARKAYKPMRENSMQQILDKNFILIDAKELANAFRLGIISAYYYGKMSATYDIHKKTKNRKIKSFADNNNWHDFIDVLEIIMSKDKGVVESLLPIKEITKSNAMKTYFKPSQAAVNFFNNYTLELAGKQSQDILDLATQIIQKAIKNGLSTEQTFKKLKKDLKTFTEWRLKAIAITEVTRAYNIGTLEESYTSDIVAGYQFDAVLDKRTTEICRSRDGMFIDKKEISKLSKNTPPLHVRCRSLLRTVTKYDLEDGSLPVRNQPELQKFFWNGDEQPDSKQRESDIKVIENLLNSWQKEPRLFKSSLEDLTEKTKTNFLKK